LDLKIYSVEEAMAKVRLTYSLLLAFALVSCQVQTQPPIDTDEPTAVTGLRLELADPAWDGESIPDGHRCRRTGDENPSTPRIRVSNIPDEADAIVLEFSDRDYAPMDNGGHGKIGYVIPKGTIETVVPSIPGNTFDLPEDFFLVEEHDVPGFDTAGAYMPPCSGGVRHSYYVTVKAVELNSIDEPTFSVLEQGILEMGKY
jgi:phosphatidylethanolamine-binding protein (PEBP) family uncharacterized protein